MHGTECEPRGCVRRNLRFERRDPTTGSEGSKTNCCAAARTHDQEGVSSTHRAVEGHHAQRLARTEVDRESPSVAARRASVREAATELLCRHVMCAHRRPCATVIVPGVTWPRLRAALSGCNPASGSSACIRRIRSSMEAGDGAADRVAFFHGILELGRSWGRRGPRPVGEGKLNLGGSNLPAAALSHRRGSPAPSILIHFPGADRRCNGTLRSIQRSVTVACWTAGPPSGRNRSSETMFRSRKAPFDCGRRTSSGVRSR